MDTEDAKFSKKHVWRSTWRRYESKSLALYEKVQVVMRRAESRGEDPPDPQKRGHPMEPIASISEAGDLIWNTEIVKAIKAQFQDDNDSDDDD